MKQTLLRYWLALNASAFDAAVHACAAYFGVAGIHCAIDVVPALNLKQLAAVFAVSFLRGALKYLDAHPLAAFVVPASAGPVAATATASNETPKP